MKRAFYFNSPRGLIEVNMELKDNNTFTCNGSIGTECYGQCREEIDDILCGNAKWDRINKFWKKYHLNDLHPGTKKQEDWLEAHGIDNRANDYDGVCAKLEEAGLLIDDGYKFGSGRRTEEIPYISLMQIKHLITEGF